MSVSQLMVVGGINFLPPQASCILQLNSPSFESIWFEILAQSPITRLTNLGKLLKLCASVYFLQNAHDKKILNSRLF